MRIVEEIECLIRARYPILYVVSSEENRVEAALLEIARRWEKRVYAWSCTLGLVPAGMSLQSQRTRSAATRDPLAALDQVVDQVEPALFLFKDLHPYLNRQNCGVVRRLKDIALHLKDSLKTVILVSPVLEVPAEIEKDVTVLHFPLPDKETLRQLIEGVAGEVTASGRVPVELDEPGRERLIQAALGLTLGEAENVFAKILIRHERLSGDLVAEVLAEKQQIVRKSGLLEYYATEETFAGVGGLADLKDWLAKRAAALTAAARDFGLPAPKGLLLLGVQGCGKSLCAKAVSNLWQVPLLRFDIGRVFGSLVGSSEENVRRAIAVAESVAPAVLWVDEIDKAFAGSQGSALADGGTTARVFGTFLTWLSEKTAPVFVVATANDLTQLPPELLRKGRLDEIFFVDLPDVSERREVWTIHLRKRGRDPAGFALDALAAATAEFSGSEIEEAVISGLFDAFHEGAPLTSEHLRRAVEQTVPLARTMAENIERLRRWAVGRARSAASGAAKNPLAAGGPHAT
jgi:ATP-dependent 26S proteasome regulatory subunit